MSLPAGSAGNGTCESALAKVGVYVCHCGVNIAAKVNVERVVAAASQLSGVTVARNYKFMCSNPGQDLISQDIRNGLVNRVVVASCSPLMHEATFRRATAAGGISPFYAQMASIREHVSWVTSDGDDATAKAIALVCGAVRRVASHEYLERRQAPIHPDVMVVGGGIAGIHAALTLADAGKHVYLVEREPSIGGQMAKFDKTFPTLDCAACILTPKMVQAGQHPNIELLTYSEVTGVSGYVGNFTATVRKKPRYINEDLCTGCDLCVENCSWQGIVSQFDHGLGTRPVVHKLFPRPSRPRPSSTVPAPRRAVSAVRQESRRTGTCRWSAAGSIRRPSTWSVRRPRWSAAWAGPATPSARAGAAVAVWRVRCRSGG